MSRLSSLTAILLLLSLSLTACTSPEAPSLVGDTSVPESIPTQTARLDVCMSQSPVNVVPAYAQARGLFHKHGLDVELVTVGSGSTSLTSLLAGDFDLCQVAGSSAVNAVIAGHDLVLVAGLVNQQLYSLVVSPEISSGQDLVGKAVAISGPGGASDAVMRTALQSLGLQPDTDVALLSIGGQAERLAAMETGEVMGTVISLPETSRAVQLGYRVLLDPSDLNAPYQHTAIVVPREFLDDNRAHVRAFLRAIVEAIAVMKTDREGTIAVMSDILEIDPVSDADVLAEAYDVLVQQYVADTPYPSRDGVQALIDEAGRENTDALMLEAAAMIDDSIIRELEDSGFIKSLQDQ